MWRSKQEDSEISSFFFKMAYLNFYSETDKEIGNSANISIFLKIIHVFNFAVYNKYY